MKNKTIRRLLAVLLAGLISATTVWPQDLLPAGARPGLQADGAVTVPLDRLAAVQSPEPPTDPEPPRGVLRKLRGKKVVVFLQDGSQVEGRLVKLTPEGLRVKVRAGQGARGKSLRRIQEIPLSQVESVGRRVKPKLLGKNVLVKLHDGRAYQGKLLDISADSLRLGLESGAWEFPLREVARVKRHSDKQRSDKGGFEWWMPLEVMGVILFCVVGAALEGQSPCLD